MALSGGGEGPGSAAFLPAELHGQPPPVYRDTLCPRRVAKAWQDCDRPISLGSVAPKSLRMVTEMLAEKGNKPSVNFCKLLCVSFAVFYTSFPSGE